MFYAGLECFRNQTIAQYLQNGDASTDNKPFHTIDRKQGAAFRSNNSTVIQYTI